MNAEQAKGFLEFFLTSMPTEFSTTKKVVAAVPEDKTEYRPDPKNMTARELAFHICSADIFFMDAVLNGKFEAPDGAVQGPSTIKEILNWYDTNYNDRFAKLKTISGEQLTQTIPFFGVMEAPAVAYLNIMLMHMAHHRGQLSAYLRPMGAKVPAIYGGSADEPFETGTHA